MKDYEKNIVLFVYRFKIVLSTNIKYLLGNKKYYQVVIKRLVDKGYLRRYKTKYLMLEQVGKKYIKEFFLVIVSMPFRITLRKGDLCEKANKFKSKRSF